MTDPTIRAAIRYYQQNEVSMNKCAKRFGISRQRLKRHLEAGGHLIRTRSYARTLHSRFSNEDAHRAYVMRSAGATMREICEAIGCSRPTARRLIKRRAMQLEKAAAADRASLYTSNVWARSAA